MRTVKFEPIQEPYLNGYSAKAADGTLIEYFRCYANDWAVHTVSPHGARKAIRSGVKAGNARKAARQLLNAHNQPKS